DATEQALQLADRNARAAQENAAAADDQKQAAERSARAAQESAAAAEAQRKVAERNAQIARDQHAQAVAQMATLVEKLDGRLRQHAAGKPAPGARARRDDLLATAMQARGAMARQMQDSGASSFTLVFARQKLGDLFREHGQGEEALRQYRQGCDLVER